MTRSPQSPFLASLEMTNQTSKALWVYLSRTSKMTKSKAQNFFLHFWSKQKIGATSLPLLTDPAIVESTHQNIVGFTSKAAINIVPLLGTTFFALCRDICRLKFLSARSEWLYNVFLLYFRIWSKQCQTMIHPADKDKIGWFWEVLRFKRPPS